MNIIKNIVCSESGNINSYYRLPDRDNAAHFIALKFEMFLFVDFLGVINKEF